AAFQGDAAADGGWRTKLACELLGVVSVGSRILRNALFFGEMKYSELGRIVRPARILGRGSASVSIIKPDEVLAGGSLEPWDFYPDEDHFRRGIVTLYVILEGSLIV